MTVRDEQVALEEIEQHSHSFQALYSHWERHRWASRDVDFSVDAASFAALDEQARCDLIWVYSHRFQAEDRVAVLLAPFLLAAPNYDLRLLLATQTADEHLHIESVLRVYDEVFEIGGGVDAVRAIADEQLDPVARRLYASLDEQVAELDRARDEDTFLQSVFAYHLIGEGVVGTVNQSLVAGRLERLGDFPGLTEVQRHGIRDEARHIGIGAVYARQRISAHREHAKALIDDVVQRFAGMTSELLEQEAPALSSRFQASYGLRPEEILDRLVAQLHVRLRSIGYYD
jgi:ribonucleotide reductase beta subunit family protein with ferritin-like domain